MTSFLTLWMIIAMTMYSHHYYTDTTFSLLTVVTEVLAMEEDLLGMEEFIDIRDLIALFPKDVDFLLSNADFNIDSD